MTARLLVTGTDTGVGKTYVTCRLAAQFREKGHSVGIYKPVCSGAEIKDGERVWEDIEQAFAALDGRFDRHRICPQAFDAPLAPPIAARLEDQTVDREKICDGLLFWNSVDTLLIEGAGGLLCPLTDNETFADFAAAERIPLLIVARLGLGTINHTLMTCEIARSRGLDVVGVILNQGTEEVSDQLAATNLESLRGFGVPVLFSVRTNGDIPAFDL